MRSSTIVITEDFQLLKGQFDDARPATDLYVLVYEDPSEGKAVRGPVHVPNDLAALISHHRVHAVYAHALEPNQPATRSLLGAPESVLTSAVLKDGTAVFSLPKELRKARRRLILEAACFAAVSVAAMAIGGAWFSLGLALAAWRLRDALMIPVRLHPAIFSLAAKIRAPNTQPEENASLSPGHSPAEGAQLRK